MCLVLLHLATRLHASFCCVCVRPICYCNSVAFIVYCVVVSKQLIMSIFHHLLVAMSFYYCILTLPNVVAQFTTSTLSIGVKYPVQVGYENWFFYQCVVTSRKW